MVDVVLVAGLGLAIVAAAVGLGAIARTWRGVRRGPGGDLAHEVIYLKGADLGRPFMFLMAALAVEILKQVYWVLLAFEVLPSSPNLFFHFSVVQGGLVLTGGILFAKTLSGFTPTARLNKRDQALSMLSKGRLGRRRSSRSKE